MIRKKIKFSPKLQSSSLDDIKRFVPKDALNTPVISSYNNLPTSYQNGGHVKQTWWEKKIGGPKMQLGGFKENQDYDIERALELGYGRDASGHMYSRDYETGRILKSKNHETYQQALDDDRKIGYYPAEYNGQTYTVPSIGSPRKGPFSAEENAKRPHGRMQELTEFQNGGSPKYQNGGLPKYQNGTQTRRDIRSNTERPETRAESEFYRLYSSGKGSGQGHEMKEQPGTGRLYPDISAEYPKVETEGDKHWNIAKFAYSPFFGKSDKGGHHYNTTDGNVPLEIPEGDKARRNFLLKDIYKYNLADEDLSKGQAWRASKKFIRQNVDPLINSDYDKFTDQGVQLGRVDEGKNWFQNVNEWNTNNSTEWDRAHNKSENFRGDRKEISERQVFRGLKDFNRNFRQQTRKDARKNARSEWDEWNAKQAQEIESAKDHQGQETPQNMTGTWWKKSMMQNGGLPKYQNAGQPTLNSPYFNDTDFFTDEEKKDMLLSGQRPPFNPGPIDFNAKPFTKKDWDRMHEDKRSRVEKILGTETYNKLKDRPEFKGENVAEIFDGLGSSSWNDALQSHDQWHKSGRTYPTLNEAVEMFGAIPGLGKLGRFRYLDPNSMKQSFKTIPWQKIINKADAVEDEITEDLPSIESIQPTKPGVFSSVPLYQNGGLPKYREGGVRDGDPTKPYVTSNLEDYNNRTALYNDSLYKWTGASNLLLSDPNITNAQSQINDGYFSPQDALDIGSPSLNDYRKFLNKDANSFTFKKPTQPVEYQPSSTPLNIIYPSQEEYNDNLSGKLMRRKANKISPEEYIKWYESTFDRKYDINGLNTKDYYLDEKGGRHELFKARMDTIPTKTPTVLSTQQLEDLPLRTANTSNIPNIIPPIVEESTYTAKGLPRYNRQTGEWEPIPTGYVNMGNNKGRVEVTKLGNGGVRGGDGGTYKYQNGGLPKYQTGGAVVTDYDKNWDYKKEDGVVYTKRKDADKWISPKVGSAAELAIQSNVFGSPSELEEAVQMPIPESPNLNIAPPQAIGDTTQSVAPLPMDMAPTAPTERMLPEMSMPDISMPDIDMPDLSLSEKLLQAQGMLGSLWEGAKDVGGDIMDDVASAGSTVSSFLQDKVEDIKEEVSDAVKFSKEAEETVAAKSQQISNYLSDIFTPDSEEAEPISPEQAPAKKSRTEAFAEMLRGSVPDMPDVALPKMQMPDVSIPDLPDMPDLPDVSMPDLEVPKVSLPDMPDISMPDMPDVGAFTGYAKEVISDAVESGQSSLSDLKNFFKGELIDYAKDFKETGENIKEGINSVIDAAKDLPDLLSSIADVEKNIGDNGPPPPKEERDIEPDLVLSPEDANPKETFEEMLIRGANSLQSGHILDSSKGVMYRIENGKITRKMETIVGKNTALHKGAVAQLSYATTLKKNWYNGDGSLRKFETEEGLKTGPEIKREGLWEKYGGGATAAGIYEFTNQPVKGYEKYPGYNSYLKALPGTPTNFVATKYRGEDGKLHALGSYMGYHQFPNKLKEIRANALKRLDISNELSGGCVQNSECDNIDMGILLQSNPSMADSLIILNADMGPLSAAAIDDLAKRFDSAESEKEKSKVLQKFQALAALD